MTYDQNWIREKTRFGRLQRELGKYISFSALIFLLLLPNHFNNVYPDYAVIPLRVPNSSAGTNFDADVAMFPSIMFPVRSCAQNFCFKFIKHKKTYNGQCQARSLPFLKSPCSAQIPYHRVWLRFLKISFAILDGIHSVKAVSMG